MISTEQSQLLTPADKVINRPRHSNTVSGPRPPALDTVIERPNHVRRNSEGSPSVATPPIQVQQATPLPGEDNNVFFKEENSNRSSLDSNLQIPQTTATPLKKKNRSRSSSGTSNFLSEIRDSANLQKIPLINKIKTRHSTDLSENERISMDNSSTNGSISSTTHKKNQDFHALFKSVPEDDDLIEDFACALQKDILLQGRIYVSEKHLCFNANIFGWVTNLVIPLSDVKEIEKKSTAIFIPNAIQVDTEDTKYFFASFLSRDTAYDLILDTWRTAYSDSTRSREDDDSISGEESDTSYDSDSYYDSDTEGSFQEGQTVGIVDTTSPEAQQDKKEADVIKELAISDSPKPFAPGDQESETITAPSEGKVEEPAAPAKPEGGAGSETAQVHEKTECNCNSDHYPNVVMDQVYPGTIESVYTTFFKDNTIKDFLTQNQKATEVTVGPWKKDSNNVDSTREISYIKPLSNPLGPKSTKCIITEEVLHFDLLKSVSVLTTTNTPDVPSGSSFSVKTRTCINYASKGQVKVYVTVLVDFTKSSWIKSTIEKASIEGQVSYYKELDVILRNRLKSNESGNQGRGERRRRGKRSKSRSKVASGHHGYNEHNRRKLEQHGSTDGAHQRKSAIHQILGCASHMLADGITAVVDAVRSPNSTHFVILCLILMAVTNIFITRKMGFIEKQIYELSESSCSSYNPNDAPPKVQQHFVAKDEDEVWNMISQMDNGLKKNAGSDTHNKMKNQEAEEEDSSKWHDALANSKIIKDRLERKIQHLNEMLERAGNDIEHVSQSVNENQEQTTH